MVKVQKTALDMLAGSAARDWFEKEGRHLGINLSAITNIELLELTDAGWRWGRPNTRGFPVNPSEVWWPAGSYFRLRWRSDRGQQRTTTWWFPRTLTNLEAFDF